MVGSAVGWNFDQSAGCLVGRLVGLWDGWLVDWLVGWLVGWLIVTFMGAWLTDWQEYVFKPSFNGLLVRHSCWRHKIGKSGSKMRNVRAVRCYMQNCKTGAGSIIWEHCKLKEAVRATIIIYANSFYTASLLFSVTTLPQISFREYEMSSKKHQQFSLSCWCLLKAKFERKCGKCSTKSTKFIAVGIGLSM